MVHIEHYVIIPFALYSLTNDEKKLFLQSGRQNKTHPSHPQMVQTCSQETVNQLYYRYSSDTLQVALQTTAMK